MNEHASLYHPEKRRTATGGAKNGQIVLGVGNKLIKNMQASARDKEMKEPGANLTNGKRNERPRARPNETNERTDRKRSGKRKSDRRDTNKIRWRKHS